MKFHVLALSQMNPPHFHLSFYFKALLYYPSIYFPKRSMAFRFLQQNSVCIFKIDNTNLFSSFSSGGLGPPSADIWRHLCLSCLHFKDSEDWISSAPTTISRYVFAELYVNLQCVYPSCFCVSILPFSRVVKYVRK